jgi:hypothetical protein
MIAFVCTYVLRALTHTQLKLFLHACNYKNICASTVCEIINDSISE